MSGKKPVARARNQVDIGVGGSRWASDLGRALAKLGFDVRIISTASLPQGPYGTVRIPAFTAPK